MVARSPAIFRCSSWLVQSVLQSINWRRNVRCSTSGSSSQRRAGCGASIMTDTNCAMVSASARSFPRVKPKGMFSQPALGPGEASHAQRVEQQDLETQRLQGVDDLSLISAGRLDPDPSHLVQCEPCGEFV